MTFNLRKQNWQFRSLIFERLVPGDLYLSKSLAKGQKLKQAIFLDLDGTLWRDQGPGEIMKITPKDIVERNVLKQLSSRWLRVAISNQTFIARQSRTSIFQAIKYRLKLNTLIRLNILDAIVICHHHPESQVPYLRTNCKSRKPNEGHFKRALSTLNLDPGSCLAIGDRITDIMAAAHAGINNCYLISNTEAFYLNVSNNPIDSFYNFRVVNDLDYFLDSLMSN